MPEPAVRLTLPLGAGSFTDEIVFESAHHERFFLTAAYVAIREGRLDPAEPAFARLRPGRIRERHGAVLCLDSFVVELVADGTCRAEVEFRRGAFEIFALARALHRLAEAATEGTHPVRYSLHAVASDDQPFPVALPSLPPCSLDELTGGAVPMGEPDGEWIATLVSPAVATGLDALAEASRAAGVEAAGRIVTRVGFDPSRRCFVRVLDRLVVSTATRAGTLSVVSTGASWGDYLGAVSGEGRQAIASVHTHLHLQDEAGGEGPSGDHLLAEGAGLAAEGSPVISVPDLVTHYTQFQDPLDAAAIVSVFPDRRALRLYGYTPGAELRLEPGHWRLAEDGEAASEVR